MFIYIDMGILFDSLYNTCYILHTSIILADSKI